MTLAEWQGRLERHFGELRRERTATVGDKPLFALEHGLDTHELQSLTTDVRAQAIDAAPSFKTPLPWIVYAAELGYRYAGDEYWQTFEEETPGWVVHGDRYWIRDCYRMFHQKFGGAEPSGAWARHFSIICWPITHAILPRDLQRQLARILYELRHSFSAELFESPIRLGEFIAARSWNATSRFRNLAEEPQLVGQIAAALLLEGDRATRGLILPATLRKIGLDLDRERRAREWLRAARQSAQERAQIRGLAYGGGVSRGDGRPEQTRTEIAALGIEPRLVLRPKDPHGATWEASLEIPDLSALLLRFPGSSETLTNSRCTVAGAAGRPLARGRLLHGNQRVTLSRWPSVDEVLLKFDRDDRQLEYLLRTDCLLRPGPRWLFRIASDGLAYEVRSLRVRPGERYIVASTSAPFTVDEHVRGVQVDCEGVHGAIVNLPPALTADWEDTLRRLGLGQAKTIEVWPAGLAAEVWDGEGHGEWLASERPCLAVRSDHPIAGLVISMKSDADLPFELPTLSPGETVFVELPPLAVGLHTLCISTRSGTSGDLELLGDLEVVMRIREARPWSPGISAQGPIAVQIDPPSPTLEQLWEGHVDVKLQGPTCRQVKCVVSLYEAAHSNPTMTTSLPPVSLPTVPDEWRRHFARHFQEKREVQAAYDLARICQIDFSADELGDFSLRCEREFTPLRWIVRREGQHYLARLLDDSGDPNAPTIARFAFERPSTEETLAPSSSYTVPPTGGLYVARRGELTAAVIAAPIVRGLADLQCVPHVADGERSIDSVLRCLAIARMWGRAHLPGDLFSLMRQGAVLRALTGQVFRIIGGDTWAAAERSTNGGPNGLGELRRAISKRREDAALVTALETESDALVSADRERRLARLALLGINHRLLPRAGLRDATLFGDRRPVDSAGEDNPVWLTELALRLASDPADLEWWAGRHLRSGLVRLWDAPTLARAARFLVISTDRHLRSRVGPGELYAGWSWS
jgi:hypothetical protein